MSESYLIMIMVCGRRPQNIFMGHAAVCARGVACVFEGVGQPFWKVARTPAPRARSALGVRDAYFFLLHAWSREA